MKKIYFALAAVLGLSVSTSAQTTDFTGDFDPTNWSLFMVGGSSSANINTSGAPSTIIFNGNDSYAGDCCSLYDEWQITILDNGCVSLDYDWVNPDIEDLGYSIDGTLVPVADATGTGSISASLMAGEVFGLRITTFDDCCGMGVATFDNFVYTLDEGGPAPDIADLPDLTVPCNYLITDIPTATDDCDGAVTATTSDPLTYPVGTHTITWEYTDYHGNITTQTQTVIVEDNEAPVPMVADLPILGGCNVNAEAPLAIDECSGDTIPATTTDPIYYDESGSYIITWTYDDGLGNTVSQDQIVIVSNPVAATGVITHTAASDGAIDLTVSGSYYAPLEFDWDNDGTGDFDDTEDLTDLAPGIYTVTVRDALGCEDVDEYEVLSTVSIEDISMMFDIYPNPTENAFQVTTNSGEYMGETLFVTNSLGQVVLTATIQDQVTEMDLTSFESGIYFVAVGDKQNNIGKVVKK
mgnify:CR=1 FL=1